MPLSIGVNLRVTGHCNQGGRKYMEDMFCVAFQPTPDDKDLEYAFFGIFDGHGGGEAATFAKEHLMDIIVKQKNFWSDRDEDVLRAIRDGYMNTHYAMWRELGTEMRLLRCAVESLARSRARQSVCAFARILNLPSTAPHTVPRNDGGPPVENFCHRPAYFPHHRRHHRRD